MNYYDNLDLNDLDGEIWKDILDYEGLYQISNLGRIKSLKNNCGINKRILKQSKNDGYFRICLYKNKKIKIKKIHILMYETFISKIPKGYVIHHIDENKENNILENLLMMMKFYHNSHHMKNNKNMFGLYHSLESKNKMSLIKKEKFKNGELNFKGENNPNSKLLEKQVIQIHMLKKLEFKIKDISKFYNIKIYQIYQILSGKRCNYIYKQFYKEQIGK
jgi:hypothetical protein